MVSLDYFVKMILLALALIAKVQTLQQAMAPQGYLILSAYWYIRGHPMAKTPPLEASGSFLEPQLTPNAPTFEPVCIGLSQSFFKSCNYLAINTEGGTISPGQR